MGVRGRRTEEWAGSCGVYSCKNGGSRRWYRGARRQELGHGWQVVVVDGNGVGQ